MQTIDREELENKTTQELLQLWKGNDRSRYSEETFELVRNLITERGEEVPAKVTIKAIKTKELHGIKESSNERFREEAMEDNDHNSEGGFLTFRTLAGPVFIKILYILGTIALTMTGVIMMIDKGIVIGLVVILLGNLVWRVACEISLMPFKLHERLYAIERHLKKKA